MRLLFFKGKYNSIDECGWEGGGVGAGFGSFFSQSDQRLSLSNTADRWVREQLLKSFHLLLSASSGRRRNTQLCPSLCRCYICPWTHHRDSSPLQRRRKLYCCVHGFQVRTAPFVFLIARFKYTFIYPCFIELTLMGAGNPLPASRIFVVFYFYFLSSLLKSLGVICWIDSRMNTY